MKIFLWLVLAIAVSVSIFGFSRVKSYAPVYVPPTASAGVLRDLKFTQVSPLDEPYRSEFDNCDRNDTFQGVAMNGSRSCNDDHNNLRALIKFPNGTIMAESKLGLDLDGSWKACRSPGHTDQCATWFTWNGLPEPDRYVDADKFPYVVIPVAGLNRVNDPTFRNKTGVGKGDLGVVVYKDKVVPVFVADGGPHNKFGEGSAALLQAIGEDRCRRRENGHCVAYKNTSVPDKVIVFLFPGSKISGLTPANALQKIRVEALRRFEELKR